MRCSRADKKGRGNAAASTSGPDGNAWRGVAALLHNANSQQRDERQRLSGWCSPLYAQREKPAANFINTGRDPIILYNYFYDAQCGQVGFQPNRGLSGALRRVAT